MKTTSVKTLCFALAAAISLPAAAGLPVKFVTTAVKTAEEGANALPGLVNAGAKINAGVTALANAKNVAAAVEKSNGEIKSAAGFDRTVSAEKAKIKYAAAGHNSSDIVSKSPAGNPFNLVNDFSYFPGHGDYDHPVIGPVGYSSAEAPEGYWEEYSRVLTTLVENAQRTYKDKVILVASPLVKENGIAALTTKIAQQKNVELAYIISDRDVHGLSLSNLPDGIDKAKYIITPKYVVETWAAYEARTSVPNVLLVIGGKEQTVVDAVRAIKNKKQVIIVDDPKLGPVNWDAEHDRPGNAAAYLAEQIRAFKAHKPLPYPEMGGLDAAFLGRYEYAIDCGFVSVSTPEEVSFTPESYGIFHYF